MSLALAREKAAENRAAVAEGRDPLADKRAPAMPTFREAAGAAHGANRPRWRNAKHIASWMQTLERHAMPTLGTTPLGRIDRGEVLRVLTPIWTTRPETARRVRQRMRTVFRWAMAHGFMETNPAGEAIDGALPPMPKVKAHLRALPYREVGSALETVEGSQASIPAKLCFRFLVLTAARSGEARGARWDEIDLQGHVCRRCACERPVRSTRQQTARTFACDYGYFCSMSLPHISHINPADRAVISNICIRCSRIAEHIGYHEC